MANDYDFNIKQGENFTVFINVQNSDLSYINLSGYSSVGYVKNFFSDDGYLLNLRPTPIEPLASGILAISGNHLETANLPIGSFEYSIRIYNGTTSLQVLNGDFNVSPATYVYEPTGGFI